MPLVVEPGMHATIISYWPGRHARQHTVKRTAQMDLHCMPAVLNSVVYYMSKVVDNATSRQMRQDETSQLPLVLKHSTGTLALSHSHWSAPLDFDTLWLSAENLQPLGMTASG